MEVITLDLNTPTCGTCLHWQGARQTELGIRIRCMKQGDGICLVRQQEKRSVLETIQPCNGGADCPSWLKVEFPSVLGKLV